MTFVIYTEEVSMLSFLKLAAVLIELAIVIYELIGGEPPDFIQ